MAIPVSTNCCFNIRHFYSANNTILAKLIRNVNPGKRFLPLPFSIISDLQSSYEPAFSADYPGTSPRTLHSPSVDDVYIL